MQNVRTNLEMDETPLYANTILKEVYQAKTAI
jgi:hypothetical protein